MEELKQLCEKGFPVVIRSDLEEKESAIKKLLEYGYVRLIDVYEDDEFNDVEDEESEFSEESEDSELSGYLLFVQVARPSDPLSLVEACREGKEVLIAQALATDQEEVLKQFNYFKAVETKVFASDGEDAVHFIQPYASCDSVASFLELNTEEVSQYRAHDEGWKLLGSFNKGEKWQLEEESLNKVQTICAAVEVDAYGRLDGIHYSLKLDVRVLDAGVPYDEFVQNSDQLGFFPISIRLTLEPGWEEAGFPSVKSRDLIGDVITHTEASTLGASVGVSHATISASHSSTRQWVERDTVLVCQRQRTGVVYEWQLRRWRNGRKYRKERPFLSRIGELPFDGSGPMLDEKLPTATWRLPNPKANETLNFTACMSFELDFIQRTWKPLSFFPALRRKYNCSYSFSIPPFG